MQKSVAYILKITEIKPFLYFLTLLDAETVQNFFYLRKKEQFEIRLDILQKIEFLWQIENGKKNIVKIENCLNLTDFIEFSISKKMMLQQMALLLMQFFHQDNENSLGFFTFLDEKIQALRQTNNTANFWCYFLIELIRELGITPQENSLFLNKKNQNIVNSEVIFCLDFFLSSKNFETKMNTFLDQKILDEVSELFLEYLSFNQDIYISKFLKNTILF